MCFITQTPTFQTTSLLLPAPECSMLVLACVFDKSRHDYYFICLWWLPTVVYSRNKNDRVPEMQQLLRVQHPVKTPLLTGCSCLQQCKHRGKAITAWLQIPAVCKSHSLLGGLTHSTGQTSAQGFPAAGRDAAQSLCKPPCAGTSLMLLCLVISIVLHMQNKSGNRKWRRLQLNCAFNCTCC